MIDVDVLEVCEPDRCYERELHWQSIYPTGQRIQRGYKLAADTKLQLRESHLLVSKRPGQWEKRIDAAKRGHAKQRYHP